MKILTTRTRLLGSAALGLGLTMVAAQPAQAACDWFTVSGTITCTTVATTNTTADYVGNPEVDRNYPVTAWPTGITLAVPAGNTISGYGLALSATDTSPLIVTNNGTIQIDAGNTATAGGSAALNITSAGNIVYTGAGSIANLGMTGAGLQISQVGTGSVVVNTSGAIAAANGIGVNVTNVATSGATSITTGAVSGSAGGIHAILSNTGGDLTVVANGAVTGGAGAFQDAMRIELSDVAATGNISVTNNVSATGFWASTTHNYGTGSVTVAGNGTYTGTGASGRALYADSLGGGAVTITGNGAVSAANQGAIYASSSGGNGNVSVTRGGAVSGLTGIEAYAAGTGTVGVTTTAGGTVTSTAGDAITTTAVDGLTTINLAGAVNAVGGDGIDATATGTGGINITNSGAITAVGGAGIQTSSTTGNQVINVGGAVSGSGAGFDGVNAFSTSGTLTVNVTGGNVTGTDDAIFVGGGGAKIVNVSATRTVSGAFGVDSQGVGNTTINNSGTISGTFAAILAANNAVTVNNLAGATLTGLVSLGGLNDTITNSGTFNTSGINIFGLGADVLTNNASGIINITGATSFTGLETFTQNGLINLNANTLTLSGTAFVNAGTIDTSGNASILGITAFSNSGTLDLAAGTFTVPAVVFTNTGTILADEGVSSITGQTSFANSGTIDLQDGAIGDVLTINSSFAGSGGSNLLIDFDDTTADRLVTLAASGTTTVNANNLSVGLINVGGVLVADTTATTANAFVLGTVSGNVSPLVDFGLVQVGTDFFLTSIPNASAFNPLAVPGFATDLWYQSANEIFAETVKPATTEGFSFWGEGYASRDKYGDDDDSVVIDGVEFDVDNEMKTKRYGLQGGIDYGFGGGRIGLTGGYGWADSYGTADADLTAQGWNVGVYGQFGGLTGFHGEFLAKYDRYDAEFDDGVFNGEEFDIRSAGIDGSLGYRFGFGGDASMDIHAGLSHVRTKVDDINAFGFDYDIGSTTSTRGRAGVRAIFGGGLAPYVDATVYREFNGDGEIELFDGATGYDLDTNGRGTWVRLEAGLSGNDGPGPILAAWGDFGDRKGLGLRAGWRFGGGQVAEVLPPPPPPYIAPPPPPPPATQTCADGSVILATDMCPPPPPPPPPPPEPERG